MVYFRIFKGIHLKKIVVGLIVLMVLVSLYYYKSPIMSSGEAIISIEEYLKNPPQEWGNSMTPANLEDIPMESISAVLNRRTGFLNELTNRKQWEITVKYNGIEPTFVIDAHTGDFLDLYGPFS